MFKTVDFPVKKKGSFIVSSWWKFDLSTQLVPNYINLTHTRSALQLCLLFVGSHLNNFSFFGNNY